MRLAAAAKSIQPVIATVTNNRTVKPRALKPGELVQVLNSTPAGQVMSEWKLRGHRSAGGSRIGDGKTIDLFRYTAWMAARRHLDPRPEPGTASSAGAEKYRTRKERERERQADASREGRDIAPIPVVRNPARRKRTERSLLAFAKAYFPNRFYSKFSQDHLDLIATLERTLQHGGLYAFALPRATGKTTIVEVAVMWALFTGRRIYVAIISASKDASDKIIQSVKADIDGNELLAEDFPEVCYPIQRLEGIHHRCKGQLCNGRRTQVKWSGAQMVLPTIEGSKASGAVLEICSITGRIRGMKFSRPDGKTVRPDFVILDDPQTDESATSPTQTAKRLRIIMGAVLGLAGPKKKIAAVMPCTVIAADDLADQVLDRKRHPDWQGRKCKMVYRWPSGEEAKKLWDEYGEIRRRDLIDGGDGSAGTKFYRQRRKVMDGDAIVGWAERYDQGEISALQHAYNLKLKEPLTFESEYQNEPKRLDAHSMAIVPPAHILLTKLSRVERAVVQIECGDRVTAFIDIQDDILFYMVAGWSAEFTGTVIDYGTEPDQRRHQFSTKDLNTRLRDKYHGANVDGGILSGLRELTKRLSATVWQRPDGVGLPTSLILIDGGHKNELGYQITREFPQSSLLSYGRGIGPQNKPIREYEKRPGDQVGLNWIITRAVKHAARHVLFDANWWKAFVFARFAVTPGDPGSLTLYGSDPQTHYLLSEHLTAEYAHELTSKTYGRTVNVFEAYPGRDNHWLDCVVGSAVAASISGSILPSIAAVQKPAITRKTLTLAEMAAQARGN